MKSRTTATGIDTFAVCQFPREFDRPGRMLPSMAPRNIATPTQTVRYLLNTSSLCSNIFTSNILTFEYMDMILAYCFLGFFRKLSFIVAQQCNISYSICVSSMEVSDEQKDSNAFQGTGL